MKQKTITDEEILKQYKKTPSLSQIAYHFKVPDVTIWRRSKKLGLEFNSIGKGIKVELQEILEGKHPTYQTFKLRNRLIKEKIFPYECSSCKIKEWNHKPISLQLDHIDGNNHNHKLKNLRLLCPNCHSQTETFCGKNRKSEE